VHFPSWIEVRKELERKVATSGEHLQGKVLCISVTTPRGPQCERQIDASSRHALPRSLGRVPSLRATEAGTLRRLAC